MCPREREWNCRLSWPFIAQARNSYTVTQDPIDVPRVAIFLLAAVYCLNKANDVSNNVEIVPSSCPATSHPCVACLRAVESSWACSGSAAPCCRVTRYCSVASRVVSRPALHCYGSVTACPHVPLAFHVSPAIRLAGA
jgi:hypothetical protein